MAISAPTIVLVNYDNVPKEQFLVHEYGRAEQKFEELCKKYDPSLCEDEINYALGVGSIDVPGFHTITISQPEEIE